MLQCFPVRRPHIRFPTTDKREGCQQSQASREILRHIQHAGERNKPFSDRMSSNNLFWVDSYSDHSIFNSFRKRLNAMKNIPFNRLILRTPGTRRGRGRRRGRRRPGPGPPRFWQRRCTSPGGPAPPRGCCAPGAGLGSSGS